MHNTSQILLTIKRRLCYMLVIAISFTEIKQVGEYFKHNQISSETLRSSCPYVLTV